MLQHVPVFPPGLHPCPYNYVNCREVLAAMSRYAITAVVAGHYHEGFGPIRQGESHFIAAPALCEAPFPYLILEFDATHVRARRQTLAMPPELGLVDVHVHTHLAYCNENMDIALATQLAHDFGLAGLRFAEHSGHLYFNRQEYGTTCFRGGIGAARPGDSRVQTYAAALHGLGVTPAAWGVEVDADHRGDPVLRPEDSALFPFRLGALHGLRHLDSRQTVPNDDVAGEFLAVLRRFLACRFAALAHPFRVFRRAGRPVPSGLVEPTVRLLKEHGTAAEVNFHTDDPDPEFVRQCLAAGVPLAFGSDAHNLCEVGEFFPHLELLRRAGYDGDPRAVLLPL
jgi:histidinol phosphatase-like PHP family hydrolase